MLEIIDATKAYQGRQILHIPALRLESGLYWLQGINGSGKTSLLHMIAGQIPFKGDILIDGISQKKNPTQYRSKVALSDAEPLFPEFLTGWELIRFFQHIRPSPTDWANRIIDAFKMSDYLPDLIGTYSSGMTKKLSLLLAFIGNASLILLDEPLATLDSRAAEILPGLIDLSQRNWGTHFLFSSHQSLADTHFPLDKKLLIEQGAVQPIA